MALEAYGGAEAQGMNQLSNEVQWQLHSYQNYKRNQEMMEDSFKYQKKLNEQMHALQARSIEDNVAGLRAAGLSPAMASGTMSSAGSGGSVAPLANDTPYHETKSLGAAAIEGKAIENQTKIADAQVELMNAQAYKTRLDAGVADYWLANNYDADKTIKAFSLSFAKKINESKDSTPLEKAVADVIVKESENGRGNINQGTLKGINNYLETYGFNYETLAKSIENQYLYRVNSGKYKSDRALRAAVYSDWQQWRNLIRTESEIVAYTTLLEGQTELLPEEKEKIIALTQKLVQERKAIMHGDIIESMREDPAATSLREAYTLGREILSTGQDIAKLRTFMNRYNKGGVEPVPRSRSHNEKTSNSSKWDVERRYYDDKGRMIRKETEHSPYNSEREYMEQLKSGNW